MIPEVHSASDVIPEVHSASVSESDFGTSTAPVRVAEVPSTYCDAWWLQRVRFVCIDDSVTSTAVKVSAAF